MPSHGAEAHTQDLPRDLGLGDLVLTQILFIVGLPWVGVAAKQGPAHVLFWLFAIVFFYLPSAVVVMHLNRAMPLEGGLYQWAKGRLGTVLAAKAGYHVFTFPRRPLIGAPGLWQIYELPQPNVGDYSPTEVVTAALAPDMVAARMRADDVTTASRRRRHPDGWPAPR